MAKPRAVSLEVVLLRHHPEMAAFVVVPAAAIRAWKLTATTTVEAALDGIALGRRSLVRWDDERWFVELRRGLFEKVGKAVGERATLVMSVAAADLPAELQALIDANPRARERWEAHTPAQRRMLREEILAAKTSATRDRRARRALLPDVTARARPPQVPGLREEARALLVRVAASRLPGSSCGGYSGVRVGLAERVGCDPRDTVSAGARRAAWETRIEARRQADGTPGFRGPAVNGPPGGRFLYLTWIGSKDGAPAAMFRRAKLRLDAVPPEVLAAALRTGVLCGRLSLTAPDGTPRCGSVLPPAIQWDAGVMGA